MYASRWLPRPPSALYDTTGMPSATASAVARLKASGSISETAMPAAWLLIARRIALTISPTSLRLEPVQAYVAPRREQASWIPYLVGTKNGFVVAWLTKTKRQRGCGRRNDAAAASASAPNAPESAPPAAAAPSHLSAAARSRRRFSSLILAAPVRATRWQVRAPARRPRTHMTVGSETHIND